MTRWEAFSNKLCLKIQFCMKHHPGRDLKALCMWPLRTQEEPRLYSRHGLSGVERDNDCPGSAGDALAGAAQHPGALLCCSSTLLTHFSAHPLEPPGTFPQFGGVPVLIHFETKRTDKKSCAQ